MRIILRSDVSNVGRKGDVLDVSDGFARNYLVPKGLAMRATEGAMAQAVAMRRARDLKEAKDRASAEEIARRLTPAVIRIGARAGAEGRLFGSVTSADVVEAVRSAGGPALDRRTVEVPGQIKTVGTHKVTVRLHPEVTTELDVNVVAS